MQAGRLGSFLRDVFGGRRGSSGEAFLELDGLRGLAVLLVVVGHLYRGGVELVPSLTMVVAGANGVQLFFVLSSFLLGSSLLAVPDSRLRSVRLWGTYFLRRFLRIYPLYLLVLIVGSSFPFLSSALFGPRHISIVDHLLLQQGAKIMWAIPVEMKFYFLLPVLVLVLHGAMRLGAAAAAAVTVALLAASAALAPSVRGAEFIALSPNLPYFVAGFAAAVARRLWRPSTFAAKGVLEAVGWLTLAWWSACAVLHAAPLWARNVQTPLGRGLEWAVILLAAVEADMGLARMFRVLPLRVLGVVSFSVYLLHMPVVEALRTVPGWSDGMKTAAVLVAMMPIAMLSYLVVEYPFLEFGRRVSRGGGSSADHRRPAGADAASTG